MVGGKSLNLICLCLWKAGDGWVRRCFPICQSASAEEEAVVVSMLAPSGPSGMGNLVTNSPEPCLCHVPHLKTVVHSAHS